MKACLIDGIYLRPAQPAMQAGHHKPGLMHDLNMQKCLHIMAAGHEKGDPQTAIMRTAIGSYLLAYTTGRQHLN